MNGGDWTGRTGSGSLFFWSAIEALAPPTACTTSATMSQVRKMIVSVALCEQWERLPGSSAREDERSGAGNETEDVHHFALRRLYCCPRRVMICPRIIKLAAMSGVGARIVVVILHGADAV